MAQLLWKTVEWFLKTLKAELSYDPIDLLSTSGYKHASVRIINMIEAN